LCANADADDVGHGEGAAALSPKLATIDIDTYDRHRDKLREELTIAQMTGTSASSRQWT
jgi:hypothetical protein